MRYELPAPLLSAALSPAGARELLQGHTDSQGEYIRCVEPLILQMWRDLTVQGHMKLTYVNEIDFRDQLYPTDVKDDYVRYVLNELIDVDSIEVWAKKSESLDLQYAQDVLIGNDRFSELSSDYVYDEEFSEHLLGYAVGKGLQDGDLQVIGQDTFNSYLRTLFDDDRHLFNVEVEIFGDVDWDGERYRELSPDQQTCLVTNIANSRHDSDKDWANVVVPHLLECMAKHDQTAENVRSLIRLNLRSE